MKSEDPIFFHVPAPFPYKNTNSVPWNYTIIAYVGEKSIVLELAVTNIVDIGGITRSGRVFAPEQPPKKNTL